MVVVADIDIGAAKLVSLSAPPLDGSALAAELRGAAEVARRRLAVRKAADLREWGEALEGAVASAAALAVERCEGAAAQGRRECSVCLVEALSRHALSASFPRAPPGLWRPTGDDPLLRGWFFGTAEGRRGLEAPAHVCVSIATLLEVVAPEVTSVLQGEGVAVEVVEGTSRFNHMRGARVGHATALNRLHISWSSEVPCCWPLKLPPVGNLVRACGVCTDLLPMEALAPCGHLLCSECRRSTLARGRCPFCRRPTTGGLPVFVP